LARITKEKITFLAGHGSLTFGLIAAQQQNKGLNPAKDIGVVGLAPKADAFMIKAFKDNGVSNKSTLIAAIKKSIIHNADVVNMSLKVADTLDLTSESSKLLERIVNLVPYLVAASGNNGDPRFPGYPGKVEAYPAHFISVPFDVGAFEYKDGKADIALFSQYEPGIGPLFVAPGFDILSTGLIPGQEANSEYVFMAGTSMATSIMTGFVTLLLAEFKDKFTREQLLKVTYASTLKLQNDENWKTKVILGVVDMRTALFILHALDRFRIELKKTGVVFDFNKQFDQALKVALTILFAQPKEYAKKYLDNVDFKADFMTYFKAAQHNKDKLTKKEFFMPEGPDALEQSLAYVVNTILAALGAKNVSKPKGSPELIKQVSEILKSKTVDLWPDVDANIKERLIKKEIDNYWAGKAEQIKLHKGQNL
jgi:Subtilase family